MDPVEWADVLDRGAMALARQRQQGEHHGSFRAHAILHVAYGALLVLWFALWLGAPEWGHRARSRRFPLPREVFGMVMYAFLDLFKIVFPNFSVVPCLALPITG